MEEEWQQQVQHIQLGAGQPRAQRASKYSSKEEQQTHPEPAADGGTGKAEHDGDENHIEETRTR